MAKFVVPERPPAFDAPQRPPKFVVPENAAPSAGPTGGNP
jgi:hypothetical protein